MGSDRRGFRFCAGMDKANAALAAYLLERKTPLHLVAHQVDAEFSQHPGVRVHLVPRPAGSFFLGEWLLDRSGLAVARQVVSQWPGARVVVNGGNCIWPDINWYTVFIMPGPAPMVRRRRIQN